MGNMFLRLARAEDAPALSEIDRPYVEETAVSLEYEAPAPAVFAGRMAEIAQMYPYLVCEAAGKPVGYAYAHRLMERPAYQWSAELTVYVERGGRSRGIGSALYGALLELLALQHVRTVYGIVTASNEASVRFHLRHGFRQAGLCRSVGYKNGWQDVVWLEKQIGDYASDPPPLLPFPLTDQTRAAAILDRHSAALS